MALVIIHFSSTFAFTWNFPSKSSFHKNKQSTSSWKTPRLNDPPGGLKNREGALLRPPGLDDGQWCYVGFSFSFQGAKHIWWISSSLPHSVGRLRLFFSFFLAEFVFNVEKMEGVVLHAAYCWSPCVCNSGGPFSVNHSHQNNGLPKFAFIFSLEKDTMHSATRLLHIDGLWVFEDSKPMSLGCSRHSSWKDPTRYFRLEPNWPLFLKGPNPPKQGLNSNQNQGVI